METPSRIHASSAMRSGLRVYERPSLLQEDLVQRIEFFQVALQRRLVIRLAGGDVGHPPVVFVSLAAPLFVRNAQLVPLNSHGGKSKPGQACAWASAKSRTISRSNAGRSFGPRLVTKLPSTTTSLSTHLAPAFFRSVRSDG